MSKKSEDRVGLLSRIDSLEKSISILLKDNEHTILGLESLELRFSKHLTFTSKLTDLVKSFMKATMKALENDSKAISFMLDFFDNKKGEKHDKSKS